MTMEQRRHAHQRWLSVASLLQSGLSGMMSRRCVTVTTRVMSSHIRKAVTSTASCQIPDATCSTNNQGDQLSLNETEPVSIEELAQKTIVRVPAHSEPHAACYRATSAAISALYPSKNTHNT